jgi:2,4-dienoyl-CoA reductase-like NADH-dependent reductase (Old Yellow Enzyme family)
MLTSCFQLPCGIQLNNRIAKAALTERLSKKDHLPNQRHIRLYNHWAKNGAGLLISGNILVDKIHLEAAGNIVITKETPKESFRIWTKSVTNHGHHFWAQLNHAGRQTNIFNTLRPLAPSSVKLKKMGFFGLPKQMTDGQVQSTIDAFVHAVAFCQDVGFTGVQIHAAHGYLLSQFLSPRTNKRNDQWGGSIENRARILFEIVKQSRKVVGPSFPISVKINSADFQRGGFEEEDALFVIKRLEALDIDLLEVSGGTYEDLTFFTQKNLKASTIKREAYFLEFAKEVRKESRIPLMVTGGFRTKSLCEQVLKDGALDIIGFGRPFLLDESFPNGFVSGSLDKIEEVNIQAMSKQILDMAAGGFYDYQIARLADGLPLDLHFNSNLAAFRLIANELIKGVAYKM